MKLGRFRPRTGPPAGLRSAVVTDEPHPGRTGRRDGGERLLDLASAYAYVMVEGERADPERASEYALAALPASMVAILGTWARSRALIAELIDAFEAGVIAADAHSPLGPVVAERDAVVLLAPLDRPPCIRDFFAFETHMKNALGNLGLDVPDAWYEAPSHYVTRSGAVFGPDEIGAWPAYTEMLDFELEFGIVIGRAASTSRRSGPGTTSRASRSSTTSRAATSRGGRWRPGSVRRRRRDSTGGQASVRTSRPPTSSPAHSRQTCGRS